MTAKILGKREGEYNEQENEQTDRQVRDLAICRVADVALAFADEPAGAEQRVTEAQADAAEHGERAEPAEVAAGILAVGDRQALDQRADRQCPE